MEHDFAPLDVSLPSFFFFLRGCLLAFPVCFTTIPYGKATVFLLFTFREVVTHVGFFHGVFITNNNNNNNNNNTHIYIYGKGAI